MPSGGMTCRFIPAKSSREWADAIGLDHLETSFTAEYHLMSERIWGGEAFLAVVERAGNRVVWPYILQHIPGTAGYRDVNSAYGFVGPLVRMADSAGDGCFIDDALDHLMQRWREMGVVSCFTRFCPFHENHKPIEAWLQANPHVHGSVEATGHIVVVDTTQTPEQMWRGIRKTSHSEIRDAQRLGLAGEHDPNWERLDDFLAIYESVGERNEFSARHRLSREDFLAMRDHLGANAALFHVMDNGRVAASTVCVKSGGVLHVMFGGPHPDYLRLGAYKFLLKFEMDWSAEHGLHYLNIGGGRGGRDADSLYQFKRGFSRLQLPFYIGRLIVDPSAYDALTKEVARRYREQGLEPSPDFFPAYRDPGVTREVSTGAEA
jgi:Acetyltransferase (GNAT) domain